MKKSILSTLFLIFVTLSGSSARKQQQYRFSVIAEEDYGNSVVDSIWIENDDDHKEYKLKYNAETGSTSYYRDSLPGGRYSFYTRDIFGYKHKTEFYLKKDTGLQLPGTYAYRSVPLVSIEALQKAEHIDIVCERSGCFQRDVTKAAISLNPDQGTYKIIVTSNRKTALYNNQVAGDLIKDLYKMELDSRRAVELNSRSGMSTSSWHLYLLAGNKLFYLKDVSGKQDLDPIGEYIYKHMDQSFRR